MPIIEVKRGTITPHVRKTPTSTCAVVMPMTAARVNQETASDEQPTKIESPDEAFEKFAPKLSFKGTAGEEGTQFQAELEFHNLKDFDPANILKHQGVRNEKGVMEYRRNDLADLRNSIDLLYKLRQNFDQPQVRRAWKDPEQRKEVVRLIGQLQSQISRLSGGDK